MSAAHEGAALTAGAVTCASQPPTSPFYYCRPTPSSPLASPWHTGTWSATPPRHRRPPPLSSFRRYAPTRTPPPRTTTPRTTRRPSRSPSPRPAPQYRPTTARLPRPPPPPPPTSAHPAHFLAFSRIRRGRRAGTRRPTRCPRPISPCRTQA